MRDDLVKVFCKEYTRHMNALQSQQDQTLKTYRSEQAKLSKERENIIQAIKQGVAVDLIKDDLESVSTLTPRPDQDDLSIDLYGDLAGILRIASKESAIGNMTQKEKRLRQIAVNDKHLSEPSVNW